VTKNATTSEQIGENQKADQPRKRRTKKPHIRHIASAIRNIKGIKDGYHALIKQANGVSFLSQT
jgi:hypothetical protein